MRHSLDRSLDGPMTSSEPKTEDLVHILRNSPSRCVASPVRPVYASRIRGIRRPEVGSEAWVYGPSWQ